MKPYRFALLLVILSTLIWACTLKYEVQPVCRHDALYAAVTWGDLRDEPVQIALGRTNKKIPGTNEVWWHAQAMARINGKWEWLEVGYQSIYAGEQDAFQPTKYMTVLEFSMWLIRGNPNLFKGGLR